MMNDNMSIMTTSLSETTSSSHARSNTGSYRGIFSFSVALPSQKPSGLLGTGEGSSSIQYTNRYEAVPLRWVKNRRTCMCFEKVSREKTPTSNLATMHTEN